MNYDTLRENIIKIDQIAKSRNWSTQSDVFIDAIATDKEITDLENSIRKKIPIQLKDLLTQLSKSVQLFYEIEEEVSSEFSKISSGEFYFDLELLEQLNKEYPDWIAASLDEDANDIESIEITKRVKDHKTVILEVSTGDLIVMDDQSNEVLFLDHEGGAMHGKSLAKDLNTFLEQWSLMGFFGTEDWQFEEMYDFEKNSLKSLNDDKVIRWINWLNNKIS